MIWPLTARNGQPERRDVSVPVSAENFFAMLGLSDSSLPRVTIDKALGVPAVAAAVSFLSRTLAGLPRHTYRETRKGPKRQSDAVAALIHHRPNADMDAFKLWNYFWQQVFTGGRGLIYIERDNGRPVGLYAMNPVKTIIRRSNFRTTYSHDGATYDAADVIDLPFMLKPDQVGHYGPIMLAKSAIQLALCMDEYGAKFFAGGGVPPLTISGPLPTGPEARERAERDLQRSIDQARDASRAFFMIPPGYKIDQAGFDPSKGQLVEAMRFQIEQIARAFQIPPMFLQDLTRMINSNAEQQDMHLVKHLVSHWAKALEGELTLKLFPEASPRTYVEHNLDGLLRGDFKTRMEGMATAIQHGLLTPNEGRALDNREPKEHGDDLLIQGATVRLGSQPQAAPDAAPPAQDQPDPAPPPPQEANP